MTKRASRFRWLAFSSAPKDVADIVTFAAVRGSSDTVGDEQRKALAQAVQLYDAGRSREERLRLAGEIAAPAEMKQTATRRIVSRLKGT